MGTLTARIDRLWPDPAEHLEDDELTTRPDRPVVRVNFVSSVDGAAMHDGLSGGLGVPGDKRLFELLRRACDVVLVGAGTVRAEEYAAMRVSDASVRWRVEHRLPEHPVFAIVSGSLDLDPGSKVFTDAPVRPIVFTSAADVSRFEPVADVIREVEPGAVVVALNERGLTQVLCEGGPTLFGTFLAADAVDELHLTISPVLEGGDARRITNGDTPPRQMRLGRVLRSGDALLLRYDR